MIFTERRARNTRGPLLASYPPRIRRLLFWFDGLTDWQRLQYAAVAILFLLACAGYLLGLGSTILLQRVEAQGLVLSADVIPTPEPTSESLAAAPTLSPTSTPAPTATPAPPTVVATRTPFSGPQIAEPPAAPRLLPAAPAAVAPSAPRATATVARPRNLETSKPEPPAASLLTPTPGLARSARTAVATAVRVATRQPTARPTTPGTPPPAPAVSTPTPVVPSGTRPPTPAAIVTPGKTPTVR
ncbi:MAG TPA: hypothetical protein VF937_12655 [Chloroflexota bacterium]